jgi:hypothetical protein
VWIEDASRYDSSLREHINWLAAFCGYVATEDQIEAIVANFVASSGAGPGASVGDLIARTMPNSCLPGAYDVLTPEEGKLATRVGGQYVALLQNGSVDRIIWPRTIFPNFDRPSEFLEGPQEMLGPARYLVLGPYFHVPRGDWIVRTEIELDHNLSGNRVRAELVCGETIVKGFVAALPPRGVFAFEIELAVTEPFLPIEVRIQMLEGAIEGLFLLKNVQLSRRAGHQPEAGRRQMI